MYIRVERKNSKDDKHKLMPNAEDPFKVMNAETHAVTIKKTDRFVETVLRSRVALAPNPVP